MRFATIILSIWLSACSWLGEVKQSEVIDCLADDMKTRVTQIIPLVIQSGSEEDLKHNLANLAVQFGMGTVNCVIKEMIVKNHPMAKAIPR